MVPSWFYTFVKVFMAIILLESIIFYLLISRNRRRKMTFQHKGGEAGEEMEYPD